MGGGYYDRDVGKSNKSSGSGWDTAFSTSADKIYSSKTKADDSVLPKMKKTKNLKSKRKNLVIIIIDGTGSMGDDIKIIFDKIPRAYGKIKELLDDVEFIFGVVGDAYCYGEISPIQITDIIENKIEEKQGKTINTLDIELEKLHPEHGGGGQGCESYELMAYYIAEHIDVSDTENAFLIFIGDENYYSSINSHQIKTHIGDENISSMSTKNVFEKLQENFNKNVFMIHRRCNYCDDDRIVRSWKDVIVPERVLFLNEAKAIVDVLIGIVSIVTQKHNLDSFVVDLQKDGQTKDRINNVSVALKELSASMEIVVSDANFIPVAINNQKNGVTKRMR